MNDPVVQVRGLEKSFRNGSTSTQILHGVDLEIQQGECVFLAGPSGSGKTTLLSIIGCVLSPDRGEVRICGQDIGGLHEKAKAAFRRRRLGFVFQRFHLFRGLRAWENVAAVYDLLGVPSSTAKRKSCDLLAAVGLADKASSAVNQLSVGQQQRVALARALAGEPELILADEPTASLDASAGESTMRLLRRLAKRQGKTVVVVTHDARIFPLADRILYLENGAIAKRNTSSLVTETAWTPTMSHAT